MKRGILFSINLYFEISANTLGGKQYVIILLVQ